MTRRPNSKTSDLELRDVSRSVFASRHVAAAFPYLAGIGFVSAASLACYAVVNAVRRPDLALIYLVAVVLAARRYGLWPSIWVSALSMLAWDYFFTPPAFSLYMSDDRDYFTLAIFMTVALIVSTMTSYIRFQNRQLAHQSESNARLYAFSEKLAAIKTVDEISHFATTYLTSWLKRDIVLLLGSRVPGSQTAIASTGSPDADFGKFTTLDPAAEFHFSELPETPMNRGFVPLTAFRGCIGAVKITPIRDNPISPDDKKQLTAILGQVASAIERIWLAEESELSNLAAETERIRNALLISVSHDLRTPLTTIIGSLSTLDVLGEQEKGTAGSELSSIALTEALRLDRFIGNLLDMTKLELGGLDVKLTPVTAGDVVEAVLQRSHQLLQGCDIAVSIPEDLPFATANFALLEQALFNVIDNAAKYSPARGEIQIRAFVDGAELVFQVLDQGEGIPDHMTDAIFQKFARASQGDSKPPGTGLGLVIARGFLQAMAGTITAANRSDRSGAVFTIRLPLASPAGAP
jgi:two-component system, OmpR family, sensor histidine kinase KdpD